MWHIFGFVSFVVFIPVQAFAYVDPGTGALLLQSLVAGVVAVIAFFSGRIKQILGKLFGKSESSNQDEGK
ncbi:MAG: hypothetical protein KDD62_10865 [Bdellovibrionales bacterium]|nr:hypothetical protein [Bdellovibrionales bacterium]